MPLLPSQVLVWTHSITMLTIAYYLLIQPSLLTSSTPVWLFGESMHIPPVSSSFTTASEPLAALALVLALAAVVQTIFAGGLAQVNPSSKEAPGLFAERAAVLRHAQGMWMGVAGTRVFLMGSLVLWSYLSSRRRRSDVEDVVGAVSGKSGPALLMNQVVFASALIDMLFCGYLWTVVKDEGRMLARSVQQLREQREEREGWDR